MLPLETGKPSNQFYREDMEQSSGPLLSSLQDIAGGKWISSLIHLCLLTSFISKAQLRVGVVLT